MCKENFELMVLLPLLPHPTQVLGSQAHTTMPDRKVISGRGINCRVQQHSLQPWTSATSVPWLWLWQAGQTANTCLSITADIPGPDTQPGVLTACHIWFPLGPQNINKLSPGCTDNIWECMKSAPESHCQGSQVWLCSFGLLFFGGCFILFCGVTLGLISLHK